MKSRKWIELAPMSTRRARHASVAISNRILVMGGDELNSVECYNPAENTWSRRAPMLHTRSEFEAGEANGFVYVMGGSIADNPVETVTSIERYSMQSDTWTLVCELDTETSAYWSYLTEFYCVSVHR